MIIDIEREKDIQNLCNAVLDIGAIFRDNDNRPYEKICPFCNESIYVFQSDDSWYHDMPQIKHKEDCAYLIAKDLSTNQ